MSTAPTTVLGSCSSCGGDVSVPTVWWGPVPPVPECEGCGATAATLSEAILMRAEPWGLPVMTWIGTPYKVKSGDSSILH